MCDAVFQDNVPNSVSVIHMLADKPTQSLVLKSPVYDPQSRVSVSTETTAVCLLSAVSTEIIAVCVGCQLCTLVEGVTLSVGCMLADYLC